MSYVLQLDASSGLSFYTQFLRLTLSNKFCLNFHILSNPETNLTVFLLQSPLHRCVGFDNARVRGWWISFRQFDTWNGKSTCTLFIRESTSWATGKWFAANRMFASNSPGHQGSVVDNLLDKRKLAGSFPVREVHIWMGTKFSTLYNIWLLVTRQNNWQFHVCPAS